MYIDQAIHNFENSVGKFTGTAPTNETEFNTLVSEQNVFTGTAPTWAEVQAKATELETADTNAQTEKDNIKASAKAKLISGEALTEEEADTIVL